MDITIPEYYERFDHQRRAGGVSPVFSLFSRFARDWPVFMEGVGGNRQWSLDLDGAVGQQIQEYLP